MARKTPSPSPSDIAKEVINAFGGLTLLSRALEEVGVKMPVSTIQGWAATNGKIPRWWINSIIAAADKAKVALPAGFAPASAASGEAPESLPAPVSDDEVSPPEDANPFGSGPFVSTVKADAAA